MSPCGRPLSLEDCLDYWRGELPGPAEAEVDEHLLACDACGARMARLIQIGDAVRGLVHRGALSLGLTSAFLERLERDGLRVRHYQVQPGGSVRCTAGPDDDLVAMRLTGAFRPGERVDLVFPRESGILAGRREDMPVDHLRGEVLFVEPADVIRRLPAHVSVIHLYGVGEGRPRVIGEYTLHHSPWPGA
jgi:hypothetical protein